MRALRRLVAAVLAYAGASEALRAAGGVARRRSAPGRSAPAPRQGTKIAAKVTIRYCQGCKWLLRSAWMAQEVLSTFDDGTVVEEVSLRPDFSKPGGEFQVLVDGAVVWDRRVDGGFPQPKELKQRLRDAIAPTLDLGHNDAYGGAANAAPPAADAAPAANATNACGLVPGCDAA
ncbi:Rdx family-domain-containing protein [Pelagophyceae sp. CCMP2097]|nr:Rdx family-domain-containing protein [Pelagophyceae sp. CCMP2097]